MARIVPTQLITTFAKRAAALVKSRKKQDDLKEIILKELLAGAILSTEGPYLINPAPNGGTEGPEWKEEYEALYAEYLHKVQRVPLAQSILKAKKRVEEMKAAAPPKAAITINGVSYVGGVKFNVGPNPAYRRTTQAA